MEREALKLALEEYLCREMPAGTVIGDPKFWAPRIATAIKEALAQPSQEPVAWRYDARQSWGSFAGVSRDYSPIKLEKIGENWEPLYTAPPQRPWVDLTDAEIDAEANSLLISDPVQWWRRLARAVLAKSKERNA